MSVISTPERLPAPRAAEAIALPRRHVLALAVLICIPVPLLSLGATVVPLPGLVERAVATFAPFVAPALGKNEGRVVRQRAVAVRALEIRHRPSEAAGTASGQGSSASSSLEAPKIPRSRTPDAERSIKPKQRPATGHTAGGSTAGGSGASLPADDDPQTGGSSGEGSGGSGGSGSGGSGGSESGGSGGTGSGGSSGSASGGSGESGSGSGGSGSGGSGSGGSGSGGSGSGGSGSGGSASEPPAHPTPPTSPTPPTPPTGGSDGSSGSGGGGSGGSGPDSTKDKPNK